jgi:hypothetical protein
MASFLDNLLIHNAVDVVAVYDSNFTQIFPNARPLKVTVKEDAKLMEHPLETGAIITDHRIVLPIEIEISFFLGAEDYRNTYRIIKQYYLNATLLTVQTRSGIYNNQLIASLPHEEDPAQYDTLMMAVSFKQVQFATAQFSLTPRNPTKTSTVNRGEQQPRAPAVPVNRTILQQLAE